MYRVATLSFALVMSTYLSFQVNAQVFDIETIALTGQLAASGDPFSDFGFEGPPLNSSGQTAFVGRSGVLQPWTHDFGLYAGDAETVYEIAREGDRAPNASGAVFGNFDRPVLNDIGDTAFLSNLRGSGVDGTNDSAIYVSRLGSLTQIARTGTSVPSLGPEIVMAGFGHSLAINASGSVAFAAQLSGPGLDESQNYGVFSQGSGGLGLVAAPGEQAPNTALGVTFKSLSFPAINASGHTVFRGTLSGPGVDLTNDDVIYSDRSGTLAKVARAGDQVPDAAAGVQFSTLSYSPAFNAAGETMFTAYLRGEGIDSTNSAAIYRSDNSGNLTKVVQAGEQAPDADPGVVFNFSFSNPVLNASGRTAFRAHLSGPGVGSTNASGIYSGQSGDLARIARMGDQAPNAESGVVFGHSDNLENHFEEPVLNASGQVAFEAPLTGPGVSDFNDKGIYATDIDGKLVEVIRERQQIDVNMDPLIDDFRTVRGVSLCNEFGSGEDGRRSGFNDLGQLAFLVSFTDGSEGVFLSNIVAVPEPTSLVLLVLAGIPSLGLCRRRIRNLALPTRRTD